MLNAGTIRPRVNLSAKCAAISMSSGQRFTMRWRDAGRILSAITHESQYRK